MHIFLWIIITILLVEIPFFAGSSPGDSIRIPIPIPITPPDYGEPCLSATDSIGKLKIYGMYVSSVEFVSKNDTGKIFSFERGKLLISQEINKDDREFIFDTIGKLKNHNIHVSSLKYVHGIKENGYQYLDKGYASKDQFEFEKGKLKILFLKTTEGKRVKAESERDKILDCLEKFNDQGLFVSSFSCFEKATIQFKDGHLTLPFASTR